MLKLRLKSGKILEKNDIKECEKKNGKGGNKKRREKVGSENIYYENGLETIRRREMKDPQTQSKKVLRTLLPSCFVSRLLKTQGSEAVGGPL